MTGPYCPSNGTEGEAFIERWCCRCEHEARFRKTRDGEDACLILRHTMAYKLGDPKYPKEWVTDDKGPRCTAFVLEGRTEEARRISEHKAAVAAGQIDMFGGA